MSTTTAVEETDRIGTVTGSAQISLGAGLVTHKGHGPRLVFHYGEEIATVHLGGFSVRAYNPKEDDLLLSAELGCGVRSEQAVHATVEQADYARRVMKLLKPYLPTWTGADEEDAENIVNCASEFLAMLEDRAERHVWCLRADNGRIVHASAFKYDDNDVERAVDQIMPEHLLGIGEDDDLDEDWDEDLESRVEVERVPESEIPEGMQITGAKWPGHPVTTDDE